MSRLESAQEQINAISKIAIITAITDFLSKHNLEKVSWFQYTPSFNDGDPCVLTAFLDEDSNDLTLEQESEFEYILSYTNMLEAVFGDYAKITFFSDGSCDEEEYYMD